MSPGLSLKGVRTLALALPGVIEGLSYRTPAFRVNGKLLARLHQDGETLVIHCDPFERELLLDHQPKVFFLTEHYFHHTWILMHLATANRGHAKAILTHAWRLLTAAPKRKPPRAARAKPQRRRTSSS